MSRCVSQGTPSSVMLLWRGQKGRWSEKGHVVCQLKFTGDGPGSDFSSTGGPVWAGRGTQLAEGGGQREVLLRSPCDPGAWHVDTD